MWSGTSNSSNRFERLIEGDSKHLFSKYNKLPTLKNVCIVVLVFVSVAALVSIIFTIKCLMALPEMEAKLNQHVDESDPSSLTLHENITLLLNNLNESNEIAFNKMEANMNQHFVKNDQGYMDLYTNISFLVNEIKKNRHKQVNKKEIPKSSCYKFVQSPKLSWYNAQKKCNTLNGFLAEILDMDSMVNVNESAMAAGESDTRYVYWLGGNDSDTEGTFMWKTSGQELTVEAWGKYEPNDAKPKEDCINLIRTDTGNISWNDSPCSRELGYICQKNGGSCDGWS